MKTITPIEFIERNIACKAYEIARYSLVDIYPKVKIDPDAISSVLIRRAENDIKLFAEREANQMAKNTPSVGDAIIRKNGDKTFIGILTYDGNFQDTAGGSFYLSGCNSYSGGFTMDVLNIKDLELTNELTELRCWLFSSDDRGGNMGVYHSINVKTYKEI